jgi:predicted Zn-ribbon and HTH transcriptional regulator
MDTREMAAHIERLLSQMSGLRAEVAGMRSIEQSLDTHRRALNKLQALVSLILHEPDAEIREAVVKVYERQAFSDGLSLPWDRVLLDAERAKNEILTRRQARAEKATVQCVDCGQVSEIVGGVFYMPWRCPACRSERKAAGCVAELQKRLLVADSRILAAYKYLDDKTFNAEAEELKEILREYLGLEKKS